MDRMSSPPMTRRHLLGAAAAAALAALAAGCRAPDQILAPLGGAQEWAGSPQRVAAGPAERLLGRVAYGPSGYDRERLQSLGTRAMVLAQLSPDTIDEDPAFSWRLRGLGDSLPDDFGLLNEIDDHQLVASLAQATLLRAVYSRRQLYERMVEFWSDHFNIYAFKARQAPQFVVLCDQHSVRPHALGRFRDLLGAMARSPALLAYLNNDLNRAGRPNENYGRELMELHTLGVHGGYTQADVRDAARCLTGWTFNDRWRPGEFDFDLSAHDRGAKSVLHRRMLSGGQQDVEELLDMLAAHPATARHLAAKLLVRFRGDTRPEHVAHVADVFLSSDGEIKAALTAILLDIGVADAPPVLKRPHDYITSALRALDADSDCGTAVTGWLDRMGQPFRQWPMPDGFPDHADAWTGAFAARWQFAMQLTAGLLENTGIPWNTARHGGQEHVLARLFGPDRTGEAFRTLAARLSPHSDIREFTALALMSPAFQWR